MILRETNRSSRDLLVGCAAVIAGVAFLVLGAAVLLRLILDIRVGFAPTDYDVGRGFDIAHYAVLGVAFGIVSVGFLGLVNIREKRMAIASAVAACAFTLSVVGQALYATGEINGRFPDQLIASDMLEIATAIALVVAAVCAALAFSRARATTPSDQSRRDARLAWAAIGLGTSSVLATVGTALYVDEVRLFGIGNDGLWVGVAGLAVGIAGAAIAALALLLSGRRRRRSDPHWMSRREAGLSVGFGVMVASLLLQGIGSAIVASSQAKNGFSGLETSSFWLAATSSFVLCSAALCAAIAFLISNRTVAALELT